MKKINFYLKISACICYSIVLVSCASTTLPQKSNLTTGVVKTSIKEGITSQAEIVQLIGSPNIITKNKEGQEVWTYSRQSFDSNTGAFGGGLLFLEVVKLFLQLHLPASI